MWPNLQFPADLITFAEEIRNGKLNFLCSALDITAEKVRTPVRYKNHTEVYIIPMSRPIRYKTCDNTVATTYMSS